MIDSKKKLSELVEKSKPYRTDNSVLPIVAISPVYSEGYLFEKEGIPNGTNHRILIPSKDLLEIEEITKPEETLLVALMPYGPFNLGIERRETILPFSIYDDSFQEFITHYQNQGLLYDCNLEDNPDPTCFTYIRNLANIISKLQKALLNKSLMQRWRDHKDQSLIQILGEITKGKQVDWPPDIERILDGEKAIDSIPNFIVEKNIS